MGEILRWPVAGADWHVSEDFAAHVKRGSGAPGIDIVAPAGTKVYGPGLGQVLRSRFTRRAGRSLWVDLGSVRVFYSHLQVVYRLEGEEVDHEDVIGLVGATGRCDTPHLHVSAKWAGQWIDPLRLFKKPQR